MLRLDIGRPELAGLVACEKDDAPGFLRIAFKHNAPLTFLGEEDASRPDEAGPERPYTRPVTLFYSHIMQSRDHQTQVEKSGSISLITLPKESLQIHFGLAVEPCSC